MLHFEMWWQWLWFCRHRLNSVFCNMWNFPWTKAEVIIFELSHFIKLYVNNENMALSLAAGITRLLKVITFYLLWIEKEQGFSLIWYMIASSNVAENMHLGGFRQQYQTKCTISTQAEKRRKLATLSWILDHFTWPLRTWCIYCIFFTFFLAAPVTSF